MSLAGTALPKCINHSDSNPFDRREFSDSNHIEPTNIYKQVYLQNHVPSTTYDAYYKLLTMKIIIFIQGIKFICAAHTYTSWRCTSWAQKISKDAVNVHKTHTHTHSMSDVLLKCRNTTLFCLLGNSVFSVFKFSSPAIRRGFISILVHQGLVCFIHTHFQFIGHWKSHETINDNSTNIDFGHVLSADSLHRSMKFVAKRWLCTCYCVWHLL